MTKIWYPGKIILDKFFYTFQRTIAHRFNKILYVLLLKYLDYR